MIFIPLFIGQAQAFQTQQQLSLLLFLCALLFGVLYQVYLLYLNDYADDAIDRTNKQFWLSGGSRVLPEGRLQSGDLLLGAKAAFLGIMALTVFLAAFVDRPWMTVGTALAIVLCWAYNQQPLQLSYRGYGEILQGLGCGVLLPLIGFYLQQGTLRGFPWYALVPLYLIFHAGNIVTALPDYRSDKQGGKRTFPVRHGELQARRSALLLLALAQVGIILLNRHLPFLYLAIVVIPSAAILIVIISSGTLRKANVSDFPSCRNFVTWVSASQAWLLCAWTGTILTLRPA